MADQHTPALDPKSSRIYQDFEQSMTKVRAICAAGPAHMQALREQFLAMSAPRPTHAWLNGRCLAMLHDLPDGTVITDEYPDSDGYFAWEAREAMEDADPQPTYAVFEVIRWDDGTAPVKPAPIAG